MYGELQLEGIASPFVADEEKEKWDKEGLDGVDGEVGVGGPRFLRESAIL